MSWDIIFLDRLPDYLLADAVGVDICCVPGVEAFVVCGFEERERLLCTSYVSEVCYEVQERDCG
jgi:hypothetical protein